MAEELNDKPVKAKKTAVFDSEVTDKDADLVHGNAEEAAKAALSSVADDKEGDKSPEKKGVGKPDKKSGKKRKKDKPEAEGDSPEDKKFEAVKSWYYEDAIANQQFAEAINTQKKLTITKRVLAIVLAAVFLFISGVYLIYNYSDLNIWNVGVKEHTHVYSDEGVRTEGDCKHFGYYTYYCTYPYCKAEKVIYDKELGNHKYNLTEYTIEVIDGVKYRVYTCDVCGEANNKVPITEEE